MNNRKRLLVGLTLLAATFLFTIQDGVLGHLMAQFLGYLFGQSGAAVAAVLMLTTGVLLIVPPGAIGRFVRWSTHSREARVEKVMREMDDEVIARAVERAVERALKGRSGSEESLPRNNMPTNYREVREHYAMSGEILAPADRKKLDDVRTALKSLQWKPSEYEGIVRGMDPNVPFETLVKGAIKQLSSGKN
jgi:hypothetical protein